MIFSSLEIVTEKEVQKKKVTQRKCPVKSTAIKRSYKVLKKEVLSVINMKGLTKETMPEPVYLKHLCCDIWVGDIFCRRFRGDGFVVFRKSFWKSLSEKYSRKCMSNVLKRSLFRSVCCSMFRFCLLACALWAGGGARTKRSLDFFSDYRMGVL